ncbi:DeoR family transcriptional regulator, carbon catabolite repression regulator [Enterococcus sp. DIV2402]|uniref:DeoR family transcriptional regulator, carbon catabolite repression regulator n=1 Tax=Candidatus Enterococcus lowellii TaxID=2230877 RepID=A0ABZ2SQ23_9ENTE|nr:DeoR/GlpR family DNA-binding transcription regulator [Enterococcus sp. DIV2402]MBO0463365.1 DeoR/GlpR transcriptional regulator [Enterococcus sp. DIV2402]
MYQEQRLSKILSLLDEHKELSSKEMMHYFNVSRDTIRRDFTILSERNLVRRTHGGIIPIEKDNQIPSFNDRISELTQEKKAIAQKATTFIQENNIYFFDVSTIILNVAQLIDSQITIYTHSLDNAIVLSQPKNHTVHLLGGKFYPKNRFYYSLNESELLQKTNFDVAFFGAAGLKNGEVSFEDSEDAYLKQLVMTRAKTKILLAEQKKFQQSSNYAIGTVNDFDYLITDEKPQKHLQQLFSKEITIIY